MNRIILLLALVIAIFTVGCGKPNPLGPDASGPPPDTICHPETTWAFIGTNSAEVDADNSMATLIEGFEVCASDNVVIDTAWVVYSDTHDQDLVFYLENISDPSRTIPLADSTGSTIVHQPPNYTGGRRIIIQAQGIAGGVYALKVNYLGTIHLAADGMRANEPPQVAWHANINPGRLAVGCIACP